MLYCSGSWKRLYCYQTKPTASDEKEFGVESWHDDCHFSLSRVTSSDAIHDSGLTLRMSHGGIDLSPGKLAVSVIRLLS